MPVTIIEQSRGGGEEMKRPFVLQSVSWLGQHQRQNMLISSFLQPFKVDRGRMSPCELNKGTLV